MQGYCSTAQCRQFALPSPDYCGLHYFWVTSLAGC
jgi:hypothetical protein